MIHTNFMSYFSRISVIFFVHEIIRQDIIIREIPGEYTTTSEIDIMYIDSINTSPWEMLNTSLFRAFEYFVNSFGANDSFRKIQFNDDSCENICLNICLKQYYPIENISSTARTLKLHEWNKWFSDKINSNQYCMWKIRN